MQGCAGDGVVLFQFDGNGDEATVSVLQPLETGNAPRLLDCFEVKRAPPLPPLFPWG